MKHIFQIFVALVSGICIGMVTMKYIVLRLMQNYTRPKKSCRDEATHKSCHNQYVPMWMREFGIDYDDLVFCTRYKAEHVLQQLRDCERVYNLATIEDLYDILSIEENNRMWTAHEYGWVSLNAADIYHTDNGYRLELPRPVSLV